MREVHKPVVLNYWCDNSLEHLETCGRTCYNSFDKKTKTSAESFIAGLIKRGHLSVLEHCAVNINDPSFVPQFDLVKEDSPEFGLLMSRAFLGSVRFSDMVKFDSRYQTAADLKKLPRAIDVITFLISDVSRSFTHQLVRHRNLSFSQQSLRYVKLNEESFTYVNPFKGEAPKEFKDHMLASIRLYEALIKKGEKPDEARSVLPMCTATEIAVTGQASWWLEFLKLRLHPRASKEMIRVADQIYTLCPDPIKEKAKELDLEKQFEEAKRVAEG